MSERESRLTRVLQLVAPTTAIAALIFFVGYTYERERAEVFGVSPDFFDRTEVDYVLSGVPVALILVLAALAVIALLAILSATVRWGAKRLPVSCAVLAWTLLALALLLAVHAVVSTTAFHAPAWAIVACLAVGGLLLVVGTAAWLTGTRERSRRYVVTVGGAVATVGLVGALHRVLNPDPDEFQDSLRQAAGSSVPRGDQAHTWLLAATVAAAAFVVAHTVWIVLRDGGHFSLHRSGRFRGEIDWGDPVDDPDNEPTRFRDLRGEENKYLLAVRLIQPFREAKRSTDGIARGFLPVLLVTLLAGALALYAVRQVEIAGSNAGAQVMGLSSADNFSASKSDLPQVILFSDDPLKLDLPGLGRGRKEETGWQYRGLHLLHRSGDEYLLVGFVPDETGLDVPVVFGIEESPTLRVLVDSGRAFRKDKLIWLHPEGVGKHEPGGDPRFAFGVAGAGASPEEIVEALRTELFDPAFEVLPCADPSLVAIDTIGLQLVFARTEESRSGIASPRAVADLTGSEFVGWAYAGGTRPRLTLASGLTVGSDNPVDVDDDSGEVAEVHSDDGTYRVRWNSETRQVIEMRAGDECVPPSSDVVLDCVLTGVHADHGLALEPEGGNCPELDLTIGSGEQDQEAWDDVELEVRQAVVQELTEPDFSSVSCRSEWDGAVWVVYGTALATVDEAGEADGDVDDDGAPAASEESLDRQDGDDRETVYRYAALADVLSGPDADGQTPTDDRVDSYDRPRSDHRREEPVPRSEVLDGFAGLRISIVGAGESEATASAESPTPSHAPRPGHTLLTCGVSVGEPTEHLTGDETRHVRVTWRPA